MCNWCIYGSLLFRLLFVFASHAFFFVTAAIVAETRLPFFSTPCTKLRVGTEQVFKLQTSTSDTQRGWSVALKTNEANMARTNEIGTGLNRTLSPAGKRRTVCAIDDKSSFENWSRQQLQRVSGSVCACEKRNEKSVCMIDDARVSAKHKYLILLIESNVSLSNFSARN